MKKMTTKLVLAGILLSSAVTAQQSRMVAMSLLDYANGTSYTLKDTTTLSYTGDRGHDSAMTIVKFDNSLTQAVVVDSLENISRSSQTFDSDNNISTTILEFWNSGTNSWNNAKHTSYTYDSDNNMLTATIQNWNAGTNSWENDIKENYTYDGNNNVITRVTQQWDDVFLTWANSGRHIYEYNWNNDQVMYVFQYWDMGTSAWVNLSKTTSVYLGIDLTTRLNQNWSSGTNSWINIDKNVFSYDPNHHALTDVHQYFVGGVWQNSTKNLYSYIGDDVVTSIMQSWDFGTMSWENNTRQLRTYDADHNVTMVVYQNYNNGTSDFENDSRVQYTYNSFNQTTSMWGERWNAGIWQVTTTDTKNNYYYEEYGTNSVAGTATVADFNLYPVPAQSFVRIEKNWNTPQAFTVSIIDLQGRLVRSYSEKATASYSRSIDVNQLPAGNYVIKIATANGKASYQQFSVMH